MKKYVLQSRSSQSPKPLPPDFLAELNDAQKEAVLFDKGPLLVIAGAGSGKTKTLVYRVARLIYSGVKPESILLLTFTRKAAQEMLKRATDILDDRCQNVQGGTFHGFANLMLRKYGRHIGIASQFSILDRADCEELVSIIRKNLGFHKLGKRFPKKNTLAAIFSKAVNTEDAVETILENHYPQFVEFAGEIRQLRSEYIQQKKQMQVLDYDDLLVRFLDLLQQSKDVREKLQHQFAYIMVDEYQDTNSLQSDIVLHLAGAAGNIMVVGDDSQSIYSFRGANFKNIMNFPKLFAGTTVVTLAQNYRSKQPVLDLTNALISYAPEKYSKTLFTESEGGQKPVYIETHNENTQSRFVCQKILELRESGVDLDKIAVLIRSGWHSNDLEVELKAHNLPFVKFGGFKFIETAHVKDVICFLRVMANPADGISWHRILTLFDGVGPKTARTIIEKLSRKSDDPENATLSEFRTKAFYSDLKALYQLLFDHSDNAPPVILGRVLEFYQPYFKQKYDDFTKRQQDLDSFKTISERYVSLDSFLSEITLEPPDGSQVDTEAKDSDDEKLTISTIHSAKGLEWHTVFLISAIDGFLPSFQSLGDMESLEEERRLLYVALTRAKENIFIIKPHLEMNTGHYYRYPGLQFSKLSRFLAEGQLMDRYAEKWVLVEEESELSQETQEFDEFGFRKPNPNRRKYNF